MKYKFSRLKFHTIIVIYYTFKSNKLCLNLLKRILKSISIVFQRAKFKPDHSNDITMIRSVLTKINSAKYLDLIIN